MTFDEVLFSDNTLFNYIGYAAALATILTFTIQIVKIIESKKVTNLSSYMYIIYTLSLVCWATYGIFIEDWIIVAANVIAFPFTFTILLLILYYDAEDKIERARRDALTNVFNRQYFAQTVPVRIAKDKTNKQDSAVLMIEVNGYNAIKKSFGEKTANKLLKTAGKFFEKNLRESDIVARLDKNMFVAYLSDANSKSAESVAKRLNKDAGEIKMRLDRNNEQNLDISIGLCTTQKADDMPTLMTKAEKALHEITAKSKTKVKVAK